MSEEEDEMSQFYCNYCGEPLPVGLGMFAHIDKHHATEVYVGPGEYDPGRKRRSIVIGVVGTVVIVAAAVLTALLLSAEMDGDNATLLVMLCLALVIVLYFCCGLYETKGRKPGDEILMDLLVDCDVCGGRMPFRDLEDHTAVHHPDEHAIEKRVDDPVVWATIALLGAGIAGFGVAFLLGFFVADQPLVPTVLMVASVGAFGAGTVLVVLYSKLCYGPRVKRMAKAWKEKHPGPKAK